MSSIGQSECSAEKSIESDRNIATRGVAVKQRLEQELISRSEVVTDGGAVIAP